MKHECALTSLVCPSTVWCMSTQPTLLTAQEVADLLRVHVATIQRWARDGAIPVVPLPGGRMRFRRADIDALISAGLPVR